MKLISNFNYATVAATCKLTRIAKVAAAIAVASVVAVDAVVVALDAAAAAVGVASVVAAAGCRLQSCQLPVAGYPLPVAS